VALAALVSFFLVFRGSFDLIMAFSLSRDMPGWWLLVITGIAELLIGFWAAGSWNLSVVVLVAWVGSRGADARDHRDHRARSSSAMSTRRAAGRPRR